MKSFDDAVRLATPSIQNAPQTRMPLARRIVLHWVVRLLITWFGFGLITAATVAGLQALSVEISPIVSVGLLAVCALLTVVAVTRLIERRNLAAIGLGVRHFVIDWLKGAGVGAAYYVRFLKRSGTLKKDTPEAKLSSLLEQNNQG